MYRAPLPLYSVKVDPDTGLVIKKYIPCSVLIGLANTGTVVHNRQMVHSDHLTRGFTITLVRDGERDKADRRGRREELQMTCNVC